MKPRLFRVATLVALGVCALKKSLRAAPLSRRVTWPVGQMKLTELAEIFSQVVPELLATSTRRIYGEPYWTLCAVVTI